MRRWLGACVAAAFLATASPARADDRAKRAATVLLKKGVELLRNGDYQGALEMFQSAYATYKSHKILLNIGTALNALGRTIEAANTYQKYLDHKGVDAKRRNEVAQILAKLDAQLGKVRLSSDASAGEIWVDGARIGAYRAGMVVRVKAGRRSVELRSAKGTAKKKVFAVRGATVDVALRFAPAKPVTKPPPNPTPAPKAEPPPRTAMIREDPEPPATPPRRSSTTSSNTATSIGTTATPRGFSRFTGLLFADLDYKARGAAVFAGLGYRLGDRLEIAGAALIGSDAQGGYLGATGYLGSGALRPQASLGVPVFFSDGARAAVRATAGLGWSPVSRFALVLELGVEHYFAPEATFKQTILLPALGVRARI